jgi:tRNA modification GTPase
VDSPWPAVSTSSVSGEGIDDLREALRRMVFAVESAPSRVVGDTAARCFESLHRAAENLHGALCLVQAGGGEELIAAEIRGALDALGRVAGAVYTDDVLNRLFSRFCVGK